MGISASLRLCRNWAYWQAFLCAVIGHVGRHQYSNWTYPLPLLWLLSSPFQLNYCYVLSFSLASVCFSYGVWLSRELVNALATCDGFYLTNTPPRFTRDVPQAHAPRPLIVWGNNWNVWLSDYMYAFRNVVNIQGSLWKVTVNQQETKKQPHCNRYCQS